MENTMQTTNPIYNDDKCKMSLIIMKLDICP